jgi:hypothetical protein
MQYGPTFPATSEIAALQTVKQIVAPKAYFNHAFLLAGVVYLTVSLPASVSCYVFPIFSKNNYIKLKYIIKKGNLCAPI